MVMSATLPGVRAKATGRPRSSAKAWILLVLPPRERPIASAYRQRALSCANSAAASTSPAAGQKFADLL